MNFSADTEKRSATEIYLRFSQRFHFYYILDSIPIDARKKNITKRIVIHTAGLNKDPKQKKKAIYPAQIF